MVKHCGQTVKATELRLVLNCRFFLVVFRSLIIFYSKYKESLKIEQQKERVFFIDLSSILTVRQFHAISTHSALILCNFYSQCLDFMQIVFTVRRFHANCNHSASDSQIDFWVISEVDLRKNKHFFLKVRLRFTYRNPDHEGIFKTERLK